MFDDLQRLSAKIVVPDINNDEMIDRCKQVYSLRLAKKRKRVTFSVCSIIALLFVSINIFIVQPKIEVYATSNSSKVLLKKDEQVTLEKQSTPMGAGYEMEISIPKDEYMITLTDEQSQHPENIFVNDNIIYWLPDGFPNGFFRDESGAEIILPKTDVSIININVLSKDKNIASFKIQLNKNGDYCSAVLLELSK